MPKITDHEYISYNSSNKDRAKQNRKAMTDSEAVIRFKILKDRPLGYKFVKQKMIGSFILDFYCSKLLLGIEIDGSSHDDRETYDIIRDSLIAKKGIKIIRYLNEYILHNIEGIYEDLKEQIKIREKEIKAKTSHT